MKKIAFLVLFGSCFLFGQKKEIVLGEFRIEGKLKRPQVVLIAAEKRPKFKPMAINQIYVKGDILALINKDVFEGKAYEKAFKVEYKN